MAQDLPPASRFIVRFFGMLLPCAKAPAGLNLRRSLPPKKTIRSMHHVWSAYRCICRSAIGIGGRRAARSSGGETALHLEGVLFAISAEVPRQDVLPQGIREASRDLFPQVIRGAESGAFPQVVREAPRAEFLQPQFDA